MDFLKNLTSLSRADERIADLSVASADTKQFTYLLRHAPHIHAPDPVYLLNEIEVPSFFRDFEFLRIENHLLIGADKQKIYILDVRSNAVFTLYNAFSSAPVDVLLAEEHLLILLENAFILLKTTASQSVNFATYINFKQINFARSEQSSYRFKLLYQQQLPACATSCCFMAGKFYIATLRNIVIIENGSLKTSFLNYIQSIFYKQQIIYLAADTSRGLIFALFNSGQISVFTEQLKQLKSSIKNSDIISIFPIQQCESLSICLCGIDANGSIYYYQMTDNAFNYIELLGVKEQIQFDCLKQFSARNEQINLRRFRQLKHAPGVNILMSDNEVFLDLIDQSKKTGITQQFSIQQHAFREDGLRNPDISEVIKSVCFIYQHKTGNAMFTQYSTYKTAFYVLTSYFLRIYAVKPAYQVFYEMLAYSTTEEHYFYCFSLFRQIYSETEALAMLIYLRTCDIYDIYTERVYPMAQVKYEYFYQELTVKSKEAYILLEKYQSAEFSNAVKLLIERISWRILNFYFIYLPDQNNLQKIFIQNMYIPFNEKQTKTTTPYPPFVPFNHCEIFEIAIKLYNIYLFIEQAQDFTQRQFSLTDTSTSLEYLKEFLFFLALSLQPYNLPRVLPEFLEISSSTGYYETLPEIIQTNKTSYLICPKHNIKYYLDSQNKNALEALVRRLNLVTQSNQNIYSTTTARPQQSFYQDFNALCKVLSHVFSKRLTALYLLESASTANTVVRRYNVDEAYRILQGKYNLLTPLAPIRALFARCDALYTLVKLILTAKNDQIRAFGMAIQQNVQFYQCIKQVIDGNINAGISLFNNIKCQKSELKGWMIGDGEDCKVICPYSVHTSFDALMQAIKATAAEQYPIMTINFSLQPNFYPISMNEEQCIELFEALQETLNIIYFEYLFYGLENYITNYQPESRSGTQLFSKGIKIVQAAVIACKEQFWHYELYRFLYSHYYQNYIILEAVKREERDAVNMQLHKEVFDRARQALTSIVSPYITEFLKMTDTELYLKYLEKNAKIPEFCNTAYQIASMYGKQCISSIPNYFNNGVWERYHLNFQYLSDILHSTYAKLSGGKLNEEVYKSLYQTQTTANVFQTSQIPQQNLVQLYEFFHTHIQLSQIQQEFIDRIGVSRESEILHKRLLTVAELDQMLKQNKHYDLSLILQYNVVNKSQARQFLIPSWKGLFSQNQLAYDLTAMHSVLLRTDLLPDDLTLPIQVLFEKHAQTEQFELFVKNFAELIFRQYQMVGRMIAATLQLTVNGKLTLKQQELGGLLCFRLLDLKQVLNLRPDDVEISVMTVKRELSKVQRNYPSWQRAMK